MPPAADERPRGLPSLAQSKQDRADGKVRYPSTMSWGWAGIVLAVSLIVHWKRSQAELESSRSALLAKQRAIVAELKKYDPALYAKPRWLVLNKLDMVPADEREARVKDFVKRMRYKGPVFEISALTREGCEPLIKEIYKHIKAQQIEEQGPIDIDPRFKAQEPEPELDDPRFKKPD